MTLDESKNEYDATEESQGITIVYNSAFGRFISDAVIDYSDNWFERGFVVKGSSLSSC